VARPPLRRGPGAALALAEDLRALADLGLIEITVDELGQLRCAPAALDDEASTIDEIDEVRGKEGDERP